MLPLMGYLGIHGVELDSTLGAGEHLLLGVPGPHVLDELFLCAHKLAEREWAVKFVLVGEVVLGQVRGQCGCTGEGSEAPGEAALVG